MSRGYDDDRNDDRRDERYDHRRDERRYDDDDDWARGRVAPHRGTLILILGILSLVVCAPLGIGAWLMGGADLREMAAGRMDRSGKDITQIGYILGIIGTVLFVISILGVCLWFAFIGAAVGMGA